MKVPYDYFLAMGDTTEHTIWLRKETDYLSSNIMIHKYDYNDQKLLTKNGVKSKLNRLGYDCFIQSLRQAKGAGNANLELAHWFVHVLQNDRCDIAMTCDHYGLDRGQLMRDVQSVAEGFKKGGLKKAETVDKSSPIVGGSRGGGGGGGGRGGGGGGRGGGGGGRGPPMMAGGGDMMSQIVAKRAAMRK